MSMVEDTSRWYRIEEGWTCVESSHFIPDALMDGDKLLACETCATLTEASRCYSDLMNVTDIKLAALRAQLEAKDVTISKLKAIALCPAHDMGADFVNCTCPTEPAAAEGGGCLEGCSAYFYTQDGEHAPGCPNAKQEPTK